MLVAQDLQKAYGQRVAVHDVSLSIGRGQIVGLLGPNGAGKSTTVAMPCGLVAPDRGTVSVDGASLQDATAPARRRLGIVPQDLALVRTDLRLYLMDPRTLLVMLGGAWIPTFVFPDWLASLTRFIPTRWAIDGLDAMTWRAQGFEAVVTPVLAMPGCSALFAVPAVRSFRWQEH